MFSNSAALITAILLMKTLQSICNKFTSNQLNSHFSFLHYITYQYFLSFIIAGMLLAFSRSCFTVSPLAVLICIVTALSLSGCTLCSLIAMKSGTVALVSLAAASGLLVPSIASVFLFGESISLMQCVGVVVLGIAFCLNISYSKKIYAGFSMKTMLLLIGTMLSNGSTMLMQKMYGYYIPDGNVSLFSFLSFGASSVIMLTVLFCGFTKDRNICKPLPKSVYITGIVTASALLGINQLATAVSRVIPAIVQFTAIDGGGMIVAVLVAAVLYKEKLTAKSTLAVALSIVALLCINLLK